MRPLWISMRLSLSNQRLYSSFSNYRRLNNAHRNHAALVDMLSVSRQTVSEVRLPFFKWRFEPLLFPPPKIVVPLARASVGSHLRRQNSTRSFSLLRGIPYGGVSCPRWLFPQHWVFPPARSAGVDTASETAWPWSASRWCPNKACLVGWQHTGVLDDGDSAAAIPMSGRRGCCRADGLTPIHRKDEVGCVMKG